MPTKIDMKRPMQFDPDIHLKRIVLVGLGGTGSHVARILARTLYDLRSRHIDIPTLVFVDGDTIEAQNVGRQMFVEAEIGCYKAETLARRFNFSLGLEIHYRNEYLCKEWYSHHNRYTADKETYGDGETLWIGAVDNHLARRELAQLRGLWIDAGNHNGSGQVILGNTNSWKVIDGETRNPRTVRGIVQEHSRRYLPTVPLIYPLVLEPEAVPTPSCAVGVIRDEQSLLVNDFMAAVVGQYVHKLLYQQPITTFMTFIDIDGLAMRSVPIEEVMTFKPQ